MRSFTHLGRLSTIIILCLFSSVFAYSGGSGEPNDPYQIANATDLLALAADTNDYNDCFVLVNDINLAGYTFTKAVIAPDINSSASGFQGIAFTGVFDGNGHSIISLKINTGGVSNSYLGLFGKISSGGIVKNFGIKNENIIGGTNSYYVGGLCGCNCGGISNCYSTGNVNGGSYVGGLCGYNSGGSITDCYSTGSVSGTTSVGGLCGVNGGSIINCYSTENVSGSGFVGGLCGINNSYGSISNCYSTSNVNGRDYVGGLCGVNDGVSTTNCYSTGTVSGTYSVGGLCGYNTDSITNCYSSGTVSGTSCVGGLCGDNYYGSINDCYSTGTVTGTDDVGGLCGYNYYGSINNCCSTGIVNGISGVGGLCGDQHGSSAKIEKSYSAGVVSATGSYKGGFLGYLSSGTLTACFWDTQTSGMTAGLGSGTSSGIIGKTTAEMQTLLTFTNVGWDFVGETVNGPNDVWRMCVDGVNYPKLNFEYSSDGDFVCPDGVDIYDLIFLSSQWLFEGDYISDISPVGGDGIVNMLDFAVFAGSWMEE